MRALRARFKRVPRAVSSRVGGIADLEVLDRLLDAAVTAPSMRDFREEMDRLHT